HTLHVERHLKENILNNEFEVSLQHNENLLNNGIICCFISIEHYIKHTKQASISFHKFSQNHPCLTFARILSSSFFAVFAILILFIVLGSFVPWLYYGFYCHFRPKVVYLSVVCVLGITSIMVSLWDKFSEPAWRPFRAAVFMTFGLSGIVPAIHYGVVEGWFSNYMSQKSLGWLCLMGLLYIMGALMYALRVPERWFPGKFDIWFHSHQIFHMFVLGGAFVHYHGITEMAMHRVTVGQCEIPDMLVY
ncbi:adiponectin receptor protein-like, partial [Agrilus planipennis]|uniref:Adiponectin receptor protein-like n=1 Tax=Agrilus planipennis TaxID=224129 RepID=A0A7F5R2L4_AGRPL